MRQNYCPGKKRREESRRVQNKHKEEYYEQRRLLTEAVQAAYKIHKISALEENSGAAAAGQKLKTMAWSSDSLYSSISLYVSLCSSIFPLFMF